jgi:arabinofuranosyltransferase
VHDAERERELRTAKVLPYVAVAVLLVLVVRSAWVTEDAYITLRTVDNWISGYGLRWNVDERVQGYTHPLWMLLLSALYTLTREAFFSTAALGVIVTAAALLVLVRFARSEHQALAALILLGLSRAFVDYSTSGLENPLSHLLLALFAVAYLRDVASLRWLSTLFSLLLLNRMDTGLTVAPALAHAALCANRREGRRAALRAAGLGLAPLVAWEAFSLFYYGALVPNTAYAKLNTGIPSAELWRQGLAYIAGTLAWDPPIVAALLVCIGLGAALGDTRLRLFAMGAALYVVYTARVGGDFMLGRFLTVPAWMGAIVLTQVELALVRLPALAALLAPFALLWLNPNAQESWPVAEFRRTGFADERAFYRLHVSVMMATRNDVMPTSPWASEGRALAQAAKMAPTVVVNPNIGFRGFYAGPRVHIIDPLALTEPLLARLPARSDPLWRVGHYQRAIPEGYEQTVRTGICHLTDPALCEYWQAIRLVTAGELWSWTRLRALTALQLGQLDRLIDVERYRRDAPERERLERLEQPAVSHRLDKGLRSIGERGLSVELGRTSYATSLSITVSRDDSFELLFERAGRVLGRVEIEAANDVVARALAVPARASKEGFDRLVMRPMNGDGWYGAGALSLGREPAWAATHTGIAPP